MSTTPTDEAQVPASNPTRQFNEGYHCGYNSAIAAVAQMLREGGARSIADKVMKMVKHDPAGWIKA